jgi:hypothetical protein
MFVRNFKHHTPKQWEAIHVDLAKLFLVDPPLKLGIVEKYMQEHLNRNGGDFNLQGKRGCNWARGLPHACMELINEVMKNSNRQA